jgi:hypothetical protein
MMTTGKNFRSRKSTTDCYAVYHFTTGCLPMPVTSDMNTGKCHIIPAQKLKGSRSPQPQMFVASCWSFLRRSMKLRFLSLSSLSLKKRSSSSLRGGLAANRPITAVGQSPHIRLIAPRDRTEIHAHTKHWKGQRASGGGKDAGHCLTLSFTAVDFSRRRKRLRVFSDEGALDWQQPRSLEVERL